MSLLSSVFQVARDAQYVLWVQASFVDNKEGVPE